jgi:hypothetical protein
MQRFGACVVTVPLEWTGVCNSSSIIKTCVSSTVNCLFDRVLAPILFTLRPVSLHQPRETSQVRLLLASVESHVLLSSIILPPSIDRIPRIGLHQMLASILFVSYQNFRLRQGFNYRHFDWILGAHRYCFSAIDFTCQKDWKIIWSVPASHAQQWPQGVASDLQGLVKDCVSYIPVYSIWAHWHNLE